MEDFLYSSNNSIPKELCDEIILKFHTEKLRNGVSAGGFNENVKDTLDYAIPDNEPFWKDVKKLLYEELHKNCGYYFEKIQKNIDNDNIQKKYKCIDTNLFDITFQIQRYSKEKGKYIYHEDYTIQNIENRGLSHRIVTYLWYLNDVIEGGETEFFYGDIKVKPEAGKLILFPGHMAFPHKGCMPLSSHKYIITGWLYQSIPQSCITIL
jgi:hypothetical protein